MFHVRDGARMHVLCLSWNGHSSRVCILEEADGTFQAGMVAGSIMVVGPLGVRHAMKEGQKSR